MAGRSEETTRKGTKERESENDGLPITLTVVKFNILPSDTPLKTTFQIQELAHTVSDYSEQDFCDREHAVKKVKPLRCPEELGLTRENNGPKGAVHKPSITTHTKKRLFQNNIAPGQSLQRAIGPES